MACWLLDPDSKEPTLHSIVTSFLPGDLPLLEGIEAGEGIQSLGLNANTEHSGRYRASVEAILVFNSMDQLNSSLQKKNLHGKTWTTCYVTGGILHTHTEPLCEHRWVNTFDLQTARSTTVLRLTAIASA